MPLAPATDRISFTNWLAIQDVSVGSLGGPKFVPIMVQIAPVLRMPFSISGKFVATSAGRTWPPSRTVRSTAVYPPARMACPTATPVPNGSESVWAAVFTHCTWRDQIDGTSTWLGAAWAEASVGNATSLTAHAVAATAAPVKKSRLSITPPLVRVMEKLSRYRRKLRTRL